MIPRRSRRGEQTQFFGQISKKNMILEKIGLGCARLADLCANSCVP